MRTIHAITAALMLITGTTVGVLAQDGEDPQPDLVPKELTHAPADPVEGENATFTATVANEGDADADSFNVSFLVDDEQVGENKTVDGLRFGNETQVTSDNWTATAGQHEIRVLVDAHDDVSESNETNNALDETIEVAAAEVDLAVVELTADPSEPIEGDDVQLSATVENQGNVTSNETTLRFFVNGSALGPDVTVPALDPGENATLAANETWAAVEGEHNVSAFADPERQIDEPDEANNEREGNVTVAPAQPNLIPTALEADESEPEPGENTTFEATIANDGEADAAAFNVTFLVDGEELSNHTIDGLDAGDVVDLTSDEWNATEGNHTVEVVVDTDHDVSESDEDDNTRRITVSVAPADEDDGDETDEDDEADEGEEAKQITICHVPPGNPDARHTKQIGEPAWQAHKDHGDHKGPCEDDAETEDHGESSEADEEDDGDAGDEDDRDDADDEDEPQAEGNGRGNGRGPPR